MTEVVHSQCIGTQSLIFAKLVSSILGNSVDAQDDKGACKCRERWNSYLDYIFCFEVIGSDVENEFVGISTSYEQ